MQTQSAWQLARSGRNPDREAIDASMFGIGLAGGDPVDGRDALVDWFETKSHAAECSKRPARDVPTARELVWMRMAASWPAKIPPPDWDAGRCRLSIKQVFQRGRRPDMFAGSVLGLLSEGVDDAGYRSATVKALEATAWAWIWGPVAWTPTASRDLPLGTIAGCALYFYWLRYWLRVLTNARLPPVRADDAAVASLTAALGLAMRDRETNGQVDSLALGWTAMLQGPIDLRATHFRHSVQQDGDLDVDAALHASCLDDEDAERIAIRAKLNPGINDDDAKAVTPDEMGAWLMATWSYIFSQRCPRPVGASSGAGVFAEWYFVSFGDVGTDRFYRLVSFEERRNDMPQRPVIVHVGTGAWCVFSSATDVCVCGTAAHAIAAWMSLVHRDHGGRLEHGYALPLGTAEFFGG